MSADFHSFVREFPSKIGIQGFHVLAASPAVGFPRLYSPATSSPKALRPSPIADGQSQQTAGRKIEVQDEDPLIMVPKSCAEVLGLSPPMFFLLDKSKTTDKVRFNRFNLKKSRVPTHEECL